MKFTPQFRDLLQSELRRNKAEFCSESLLLMKEALGSHFEIMLIHFSFLNNPFRMDLEKGESVITEICLTNDSTQFQLRNSPTKNFFENEIRFDLPRALPLHGSPQRREYVINLKRLEYACKSKYWSIDRNESKYTSISNFDCYIDPTYANEDLFRVKNYGNTIYNTDAWCAYLLHSQN